ncbi:MAG: pyridoxamine 5'-phosphate oxidase family protein [Chitinophagaceae bacterium]|nr:pyridoxamine 5'-phosphate oxidase family protein [Chitinophagaceae bacterium]
MEKVQTTIDDRTALWIKKQKIFFVATAPLNADGHINCSPKGLDSFRILDAKTVAYQDLTGSGAETIAHLKENGRIVIMFTAFEGPPNIVRLHGQGSVITPEQPEFESIAAQFPQKRGVRAYIKVHITRVADSCGYSVPLYEFKSDRDVLDKWLDKKDDQYLNDYRRKNNTKSIDGLEALVNEPIQD